MDVREKLVELIQNAVGGCARNWAEVIADHLIANGVMVNEPLTHCQQWIPASEPPKKNGDYLCVILASAVGNKRKYTRKILYWEDNVWISTVKSYRIENPLYWMPMEEMPEPPKEG